MQSKVVSDKFKGWCPDGFTREALKVGDVRDFGNNTSGLMKEGLIEPADMGDNVVETPAPTVIEATVVVQEPAQTEKRSYTKRK